jgi:hypothetical protein
MPVFTFQIIRAVFLTARNRYAVIFSYGKLHQCGPDFHEDIIHYFLSHLSVMHHIKREITQPA